MFRRRNQLPALKRRATIIPPLRDGRAATSVAGKVYRVEYKNVLTAQDWTMLLDIAATGTSAQFLDFNPLVPTRSYRVRLVSP